MIARRILTAVTTGVLILLVASCATLRDVHESSHSEAAAELESLLESAQLSIGAYKINKN